MKDFQKLIESVGIQAAKETLEKTGQVKVFINVTDVNMLNALYKLLKPELKYKTFKIKKRR